MQDEKTNILMHVDVSPEAQRYSTIDGAKSKAYYGFSPCPGQRQAWTLTLTSAFKLRLIPGSRVNFSASQNSPSSMIIVSFRDLFIPA
jgi:hypothetical protein